MPHRRAAVATATALLALTLSAGTSAAAPAHLGAAAGLRSRPSAADLADLGRLLVIDLPGTSLDGATRSLITRQRVGGVILFGRNIRSAGQVAALDRALHAAAGRRGVLVTTDQEGGTVRRLSFAGPTASAATLAAYGPAAVRAQMLQAGRQLRHVGIDVDLAPVADVAGGFLGSRSYGTAPSADVAAAVAGLQAGGVAATAKHFPGLGRTPVSTDDAPVTGPRISGAALAPFVAATRARVRLVMVDLAVHPGLGSQPAALQRSTYDLLRGPKVRFSGVTITDALDAGAVARFGEPEAAVRAVAAGADLVLVPGGPVMATRVLQALRRAVLTGRISSTRLHQALDRARGLELTARS